MARQVEEVVPGVWVDWARLRRAARALQLQVVFLFGSRARRTAQPASDIDLAVRTAFPRWRDWRWQVKCERWLAEAVRGAEVDVVFLNKASPTLLWEACQGILLYEDQPLRGAMLRSYALRLYEDQEKLRRAALQSLRQRYGRSKAL
ncbi:MAG: nucleotidyltransferase domain-containing protein [Anaerolineae bacterium]|nr:nucleotidyltransferase domain-containing protein [Anaerolineae bacterium]